MAMKHLWLLFLIGCSPAIAQQPPEVVFRVTTSLVQVDAVVTDSKGHYLTDLSAGDFIIEEDGKPQQITSFSYVGTGSNPVTGSTPPRAKPALNYLAAPAAPLRPAEVRRTIVLMVDNLGMSFESV